MEIQNLHLAKACNHLSPSLGRDAISRPSQSQTVIQAKLETTTPGDAYEQEAENTAKLVMRQIADGGDSVKPTSLRRSTPTISCFGGKPVGISSQMESQLNSMRGGGYTMPAGLRSQMESCFGRNFSNVRLHTDSIAAATSSSIHANAFTHGNDIYFNQGQYQPNSEKGQHLIAHELTHTVQQSGKVGREDSYNSNEKCYSSVEKENYSFGKDEYSIDKTAYKEYYKTLWSKYEFTNQLCNIYTSKTYHEDNIWPEEFSKETMLKLKEDADVSFSALKNIYTDYFTKNKYTCSNIDDDTFDYEFKFHSKRIERAYKIFLKTIFHPTLWEAQRCYYSIEAIWEVHVENNKEHPIVSLLVERGDDLEEEKKKAEKAYLEMKNCYGNTYDMLAIKNNFSSNLKIINAAYKHINEENEEGISNAENWVSGLETTSAVGLIAAGIAAAPLSLTVGGAVAGAIGGGSSAVTIAASFGAAGAIDGAAAFVTTVIYDEARVLGGDNKDQSQILEDALISGGCSIVTSVVFSGIGKFLSKTDVAKKLLEKPSFTFFDRVLGRKTKLENYKNKISLKENNIKKVDEKFRNVEELEKEVRILEKNRKEINEVLENDFKGNKELKNVIAKLEKYGIKITDKMKKKWKKLSYAKKIKARVNELFGKELKSYKKRKREIISPKQTKLEKYKNKNSLKEDNIKKVDEKNRNVEELEKEERILKKNRKEINEDLKNYVNEIKKIQNVFANLKNYGIEISKRERKKMETFDVKKIEARINELFRNKRNFIDENCNVMKREIEKKDTYKKELKSLKEQVSKEKFIYDNLYKGNTYYDFLLELGSSSSAFVSSYELGKLDDK